MGKLIYFPFHGRGQQIRMLLTHAKVEFEDYCIAPAKFKQKKENKEFPYNGNLPVWEEDGM